MKPELFNRIVDFLCPHMDGADRKTLITPSFMNYDRLYSQIDWSGASREFVVRLVGQFSRYGEIEPGEQALARLIQAVRTEVGIGGQQEADTLLALLSETGTAQEESSSEVKSPTRTIEELLREQKEKPKPQGPTRGISGSPNDVASKGGNTTVINTGGGAYIAGNVDSGGEFVGRDKVTQLPEPDDALESVRGGAPTLQPTELRLDTAVPDKVEYQQIFPVAVAVRQPESEQLNQENLPKVHSGPAQIVWPAGVSSVDLRLEISAPDCEIEGANSHSFQLFQDHNSPIVYFWLKSKKAGQIGIVVNLYQDQNVLGSALARTTVQTQKVGEVQVQLKSEAVPKPSFPLRDASAVLSQDKFESFQAKMDLVTDLLACPAVRSRNTRDAIVENLPMDIRNRIERSNIDHIDVMSIVSRTLDFPEGLMNFLKVIRFYEGESVHMSKVDERVA